MPGVAQIPSIVVLVVFLMKVEGPFVPYLSNNTSLRVQAFNAKERSLDFILELPSSNKMI
jgi:hypothetical protein